MARCYHVLDFGVFARLADFFRLFFFVKAGCWSSLRLELLFGALDVALASFLLFFLLFLSEWMREEKEIYLNVLMNRATLHLPGVFNCFVFVSGPSTKPIGLNLYLNSSWGVFAGKVRVTGLGFEESELWNTTKTTTTIIFSTSIKLHTHQHNTPLRAQEIKKCHSPSQKYRRLS